MLIEYKIKFEHDGGVTITQRVEPDASGEAHVTPTAYSGALTGQSLGSSVFQAGPGSGGTDPTGPGGGKSLTGKGAGGTDPTGPGGGGSGERPIVILGPIVVGPPPRKQASKDHPIQSGKGSLPEKTLHRQVSE